MANEEQNTANGINYHSLHYESFEKQKHCDVFFKCKNENDEWEAIGAHKMVLALVSPIFEAMFYGSLVENNAVTNEKEIEINDILMKTFKQFLTFVYGKIVTLNDCNELLHFYYAACKYNFKEALDFVNKRALETMNLANSIPFYEAAVCHQNEILKDACIEIFSENISDILSSLEFLDAKPETVNSIFELEIPAVFSEIDFMWALERYIHYNEKTDPVIASKVRPALKQIRFLTMQEEVIQFTSLLTDEEKAAIIECFPKEADLSKMPHGFSVMREKRQFRLYAVKSDIQLFIKLQEIHARETCRFCVYYIQHSPWNCPKGQANKQKIKEIFEKYQHKDLTLYSHDDLEALYVAYKTTGLIK